MNQFNISNIYTVFTQHQNTKPTQVPIDYKPGDRKIFSDIKQGAKISWSKQYWNHSESVSYHYGIMLEINIKRYLKIAHIFFKCNVTFTKRDIWLKTLKALIKLEWKNTEGDCREENI